MILLSVAGYIGAPQLVELFRKGDPEVTAVGIAALRFSCISFSLSGGIVMSNMFLQSIGMAVRASIVAAARQGLFFLPLIFILPSVLGLKGVEMCQMVSDILTFLLAMPLSISVLKKMGTESD